MGDFLNIAGTLARQLSHGDATAAAAQLAGVLLPNLLPPPNSAAAVPEPTAASSFGGPLIEAKLGQYFGKAVDSVLRDKSLRTQLPSPIAGAFEAFAAKHRSKQVATGDLDQLFADIHSARTAAPPQPQPQDTVNRICTALEPIIRLIAASNSRGLVAPPAGGAARGLAAPPPEAVPPPMPPVAPPTASNAATLVNAILNSFAGRESAGTAASAPTTAPAAASSSSSLPRASLPLLGVLGGGAVEGTLPGGLATFANLMPLLPEVIKHLPTVLQAARAWQP